MTWSMMFAGPRDSGWVANERRAQHLGDSQALRRWVGRTRGSVALAAGGSEDVARWGCDMGGGAGRSLEVRFSW